MTAPRQLFSRLSSYAGPSLPMPGAVPTGRALTVGTWQAASRGLLVRVDTQRFQGTGRIAGTVKVITTPAPSRKVRLYDKVSGVLARETTSDASGRYAFENLDRSRSYYATAFDNAGGWPAVTEDRGVVPA